LCLVAGLAAGGLALNLMQDRQQFSTTRGNNAAEALEESRNMVESAVTDSGGISTVETRLASTKNQFGASDGKSLAIEVYAYVDEPVDEATLTRIKERWVKEFGYIRGPVDGDVTRFTKGDRTAVVGNNAASVGGPGRTWFRVTTEFFDPGAARAAVGSP